MIGIILVIITYFYFLLFAQFAFLEILKQAIGISMVRSVMVFMGGAGFVTSLFLPRFLSPANNEKFLNSGLLICSLAAILSLFVKSILGFEIVAVLIGLGLAFSTVSLASDLKKYIGYQKLGFACGIGTGFAYFLCNLPLVFTATANIQCLLSAGFCLVGIFMLKIVKKRNTFDTEFRNKSSVNINYSTKYLRFAIYVLIFFALVWFDCGAFYVIQQAGELKSITWKTDFSLLLNSAVHLLFAVGAGIALDFGLIEIVLVLAHLFLSLGVVFLNQELQVTQLSGPFYCIGVSFYSTALVTFPTFFEKTASIKYGLVAALLYGISGWIGSAMGIGMAQDLNRVPITFIIISGMIVVSLVFYLKSKKLLFKYLNLPSVLFLIVLLISTVLISPKVLKAENLDDIQKGRRVYIQEGCINCHSQYVRPNTFDEILWGPYVPKERILSELPPLIGNRRNGPDLLNVGNRRSFDWLKQHMIYPEVFSPGSKMPSYDYLFLSEDGENLVKYLYSLGSESVEARLEMIGKWQVNENLKVLDLEESKLLYSKNCQQCHGENGLGDGLAAEYLSSKSRKLLKSEFIYLNPESLDYRAKFSRLIKFGIFGTSMPGHEYLTDTQILSIVNYVENLN
jgi:cbb3-type cytochrome c oxidase subunit II